jgi:hypothetical protein
LTDNKLVKWNLVLLMLIKNRVHANGGRHPKKKAEPARQFRIGTNK